MKNSYFGPQGMNPSHFIQNVPAFKPFNYDGKSSEVWSEAEDTKDRGYFNVPISEKLLKVLLLL